MERGGWEELDGGRWMESWMEQGGWRCMKEGSYDGGAWLISMPSTPMLV
ncbi:hypothetical protein A2U01_0087292, partial [Trifolium medium]|nr:hypothetical protein [Trifolium medium]